MDFVIIANAWSAGRDNPTSKHQIAAELAGQGHRVLWVEGAGMRRPALGSGTDRGRILRRIQAFLKGAVPAEHSDIRVLSPLLIPVPKLKWVRVFNGWLFAAAACRWCRRLGFNNPILINYVPVLAEAMRFWPRRLMSPLSEHRTAKTERPLVVYHCVDRWDKFEMYASRMMKRVDADCCRYADLVVASSRGLYEHCSGMHDRVRLVTHGVNRDHFRAALTGPQRPEDLPAGAIAGFFGLVSEWVDQKLLVNLAREIPDLQIVLIGKADVPIEVLEHERNIHLLGPRPFADLPSYLAHFNVGLIPFSVTELTRAVNPIKLREMLAAGCPVVSTELPEVAVFTRPESRAVTVAGDTKAFVAAVRSLIERPLTVDEKQAISESMRNETWTAKVREIVEFVLSET